MPDEVVFEFSKFVADTLKREKAKTPTPKPEECQQMDKEQELTPNQEYYRRYSNRVEDRFWIGPRRY